MLIARIRHRASTGGPCEERDRGVAAAELLGFLPVLLLVALGLGQGLVAGAASAAAHRAARDASRAVAAGGATPAQIDAIVRRSVGAWLADRVVVEVGPQPRCDDDPGPWRGTAVVVCVDVPVLAPGAGAGWEIRAGATLPRAATWRLDGGGDGLGWG